jgi:hypothetical protein
MYGTHTLAFHRIFVRMKIISLIFIRFSYVSLIRNGVTGPLNANHLYLQTFYNKLHFILELTKYYPHRKKLLLVAKVLTPYLPTHSPQLAKIYLWGAQTWVTYEHILSVNEPEKGTVFVELQTREY